jgi:exonuclease VII large subunit
MGLDTKIDRLSKTIEDKLTAPYKDPVDVGPSDKLEKAAKNLTELAAGLEAKINKVTDTTSQLANTATTYRDALLNKTANAANKERANAINPTLNAATNRKMRQVMIQVNETDLAALSQEAILEKAKKAIEQISDPPSPRGHHSTKGHKT